MLNSIRLGLDWNEALLSSSAFLNEPGPLSLVFVTIYVTGGIRLTYCRQAQNSDVLPDGSAAVAVINWPSGGRGRLTLKAALLSAPVVTDVLPSQCLPSPLPLGSHSTLA